MSEPHVEKQPPLPPFVQFCCAAVPMVFDDSLSYYEALCAMWKYLDETVKVINNNALVTEDFIAKVNELHDYVEHYFDNLDVQEEINNKLDAMVEAGTLQEIIGEYLNATAVWGFDSVADMKAATNLINGSYAQTLGYNAKNDGGASLYKIRTITNDDVVDEGLIIALNDDTLVAELIVLKDTIKPEQFGAYGDATHDDTLALRKAIQTGKNVFLTKNYYITASIISDIANLYLRLSGLNKNKLTRNVEDNCYSAIVMAEGVEAFEDITNVYGFITGVNFVTKDRTENNAYKTGAVFSGCTLRGVEFSECCVARIGHFLYDTNVMQVTRIFNCTFLNIHNFAYCTDYTTGSFVDSYLTNCYINGGKQTDTNNYFFPYWQAQGSFIENCFIDYYYIMYKSVRGYSFLPKSRNNTYEVFRYLYESSIGETRFSSLGDTFHWMSGSDYVNSMPTLSYTGHDSQSHTVPNCILWHNNKNIVYIKNAHLPYEHIETSLVFLQTQVGAYRYERCVMTLSGSYRNTADKDNTKVVIAEGGIYHNQGFKYNVFDLPFIPQVETLPDLTGSYWNSDFYAGQKVELSNVVYRALYDYDTSSYIWQKLNCLENF